MNNDFSINGNLVGIPFKDKKGEWCLTVQFDFMGKNQFYTLRLLDLQVEFLREYIFKNLLSDIYDETDNMKDTIKRKRKIDIAKQIGLI